MKKILQIVTALLLFLAAVSLSVTVTLNFRPLYYADIGALDIPGFSGFDETAIRENYDALIDYTASPFSGELRFPSLSMSETGEIHFAEVRTVFRTILLILIVSLALAAVLIYFLRKEKPAYLLGGAVASVLIPAAVGVFIAVDWEKAFLLMHNLLFRNGFWRFDPLTDPVILMLPSEFFMHCGIMIVSLVLFFALLMVGIYFIIKKKRRAA